MELNVPSTPLLESESELLLLISTIGKSELLIIIFLKRNSEQYRDMKIKSVSESDILIINNKSERVCCKD